MFPNGDTCEYFIDSICFATYEEKTIIKDTSNPAKTQRLNNVDATLIQRKRKNFESTLFQRCVPARLDFWLKFPWHIMQTE